MNSKIPALFRHTKTVIPKSVDACPVGDSLDTEGSLRGVPCTARIRFLIVSLVVGAEKAPCIEVPMGKQHLVDPNPTLLTGRPL